MDGWYVISTRHASESYAAEWIARVMRGLTYYPMSKRRELLVSQGTHHLTTTDERAAFYGYVFARFDYVPDWELLRRCSHVNGLLKIFSHEEIINGIPYPVYIPWQLSDAEIVELNHREADGAFNAHETNPLIKKLIGRMVRIPYGIFMGRTGKVKRVENGLVTLTLPVVLSARPTRLSFKIEELFAPTDW